MRGVSDDFECSRELAQALDGHHATALEFWETVARGNFRMEVRQFLRCAAADMVKANRTKGPRRADAIVKATRLVGARDLKYELREWLRLNYPLGEDGQRRRAWDALMLETGKPPPRKAEILTAARDAHPELARAYSEPAQWRKLVDRELAKLR